ncbi:MAG: DNA polymerase III subunit epsilon [Bacteroidetes bacterium]|nr:MAG: DNA polymerase III subunit epsilon [Bacteroidota bacterium]
MASKDQRFAIIDVETTGGRASRDKITEIGIVLHDGQQIIGTYESLLNPQTYIPAGIVQLTGITQEMVRDAPLFHEIARDIVEFTEGAIFVAHNVRFDYGFLREEFARLSYTYTRKQLCTVRMSRKAFPGLKSYSLENLIKHFGIATDARHRALADALATANILERILAKESNQEEVKLMVNLGVKESKLPKGITLEQIHNLPEACGVYYFHDAKGNVVYVGKSINIKKRIAEHFADQTDKGRQLQQHVADVSYELTGSELVALLLESHEIKRLHPPINRAQRRSSFPFAIHTYTNEDGFICFDVIRNDAKTRDKYEIISEYPTMTSAKGRLNYMLRELELCSRYCHLFPGTGACFHYHLKQCRGACAGQETVADYNERASDARERMRTVFDTDFFLIDQGRSDDEKAVVLVEQGHFSGFGYVDAETSLTKTNLRDAVKTYPGYPDTARIIQRFLNEHPKAKIIKLS